MSEVKWIKIATDIFDNEKIKLIESMPEGDAIIVVWFKILALAGNINEGGYIFLTKDIPYTEQMLSTLFNRPVSTIQLALNTFEKFRMIDIVDDIIYVSNWEKYQNVEGMEKIRQQTKLRVAKFRDRKKLECNVTSNVTVTDGNATDIDIDKDIEKEKEINKKVRHHYGDFRHVLLTDDEYQRLIAEYGERSLLEGIKNVDEYCQETGKTYKDYNLTLRRWGIKAQKLPPKKEQPEEEKPSDEWQKMFEED